MVSPGTSEELVELVRSLGAHAAIREIAAADGVETVCVYAGERDAWEGIRRFDHGIFVARTGAGWIIEFGQDRVTRPLKDPELRDLLREWVAGPGDEVFDPVEGG